MNILKSLEDNSILIIPNNLRNKVLKYFSNEQIFKDIKIMTLRELKKSYFFDYSNQTINYVIEKFHVTYAIAVEYINSLYYISNTTDNDKMNFLKNLKEDLDKHNLLIYDSLFINLLSFKNKMYVFGFNYLKKYDEYLLEQMKNYINVEILNNEVTSYNHIVNKFNTMDIEIKFVAEKIAELINKGIDINKIFIVNYNEDYRFTISNVFKQFKIPLYLPVIDNLYSTVIAKYFIDYLDNNIDVLLHKLRIVFKADIVKENDLIINKINNLINNYYWCDDLVKIKYLMIEEMKKIRIPKTHMLNEIKISDLLNNYFNDDEYVFLIGFNEGSIPKVKLDEDYLDDLNKPEFVSTSIEENSRIKESTIRAIKEIKNLTITYSLSSNFNEYLPSYLLRDESLSLKPINNFISKYSNISNELYLADSLDNYLKYNIIDENLEELKYYKINYKEYDNQFKGINNQKLLNTLDNHITLSYTSINDFYKCPFKFYLSNVLHLKEYEELFEAFVGSLFHHCLEKCLDSDLDIDETYNSYINNFFEGEMSNKEKYFLDILRDEIKDVIQIIKEQLKHSQHQSTLMEKKIEFTVDKEIRFKIKGFVDKLLVFNNNVVIIDYKTNEMKMKRKEFKFGSTIQLPIYLYLLKIVEPEKKICGIYLQHILSDNKKYDSKKSRIEIMTNNLKLQGLTLNEGIRNFDDTTEKSTIIQGVREKDGVIVGNNVLNTHETEDLINLMEDLLNNVMNKIIAGDFKINPIVLKQETGCSYCDYKDICYRRGCNYNYVSLDEEGDDDE